MPKVSIIVRTRNEERWIAHCLRMVFKQSFLDFDVVIVDNQSTDHTLRIAQQFPVQIVSIDEFLPGRALNVGIEASLGEFIVCLSAHCVPKDVDWLAKLLRNFDDPQIAGVYGRQVPVAFSADVDKRDLLITFGLDRRIQKKDAFFHNANSMVRRAAWEEIPFDAEVTNIEDRVWAKAVLATGRYVAYEPEAAVFHHHGIHQGIDQARAKSVVRVLEGIEADEGLGGLPEVYDPDALEVVALLPVLGEPERVGDVDLLTRCIDGLDESGLVNRIVVLLERSEWAVDLGSETVMTLRRPAHLAEEGQSLVDVLRFGLEELERQDLIPDIVLYVNYLYPFRPPALYRTLVTQLLGTGVDTVLAAEADYSGSLWIKRDGQFSQVGMGIGTGLVAGAKREVIYRPVAGLGCATYAEYIRAGRLIGDRVELIPIKHALHGLKVRDDYSRWVAERSFEVLESGDSDLPGSSPPTRKTAAGQTS